MVFSWNFIHPKMFEFEYDLRGISTAHQQTINELLTGFLEIGNFIKYRREFKNWCSKVGAKKVEVHRNDMSNINSWKTLVATLLDLAEKSTQS